MELLLNNYVINLESRPDRLEHVKAEFSKLGIEPVIVEAIPFNPGNIGCTLSHIKCLEMAIEKDYDHIFICEDDITFKDINIFKDSLEKFHENIENWDVLIIGGNVGHPYEHIGDYCLRTYNCQTTIGYVVQKHYYSALLENFKQGVELLQKTKKKKEYSLDMYWKILQKNDKWFMIYPLTITQYPNFSNIEKRRVNFERHHLSLDFGCC